MKKLFTTAAVALFMLSLASCSDDDSSSNNSNSDNVLLTKIVEHDETTSVTSTYTYDGNKLKTITFNTGDTDVYTYSGDLITKVESYSGTTLKQTELYTYNTKGQVIERIFIDKYTDSYERILLVYNNDNTISTTQYIGTTAKDTELTGTGVITIKNDNAVKYAFTYDGDSTPEVETYTYDNKKNPWKNITGMAATDVASTGAASIEHNLLTEESTEGNYTNTYIYNDAGYPISSVETDEDNDSYTTEYFY